MILEDNINELKDYFYDDKDDDFDVVNQLIDLNIDVLNNGIRTFKDLKKVRSILDELYEVVSVIEEENNIDEFFKEGKDFDIVALRKDFFDKELFKKFPNFDIEKYLGYLVNPIKEVKNFKGEIIRFDPFWIKKNLIAINQMIFNEMDIYILNVGKEGSGKSCWSSQQILYFYTFLSEVGLIDYAFDVTKMFYIDITGLLEAHDSNNNNDFFRIECLDEGNQLNRSNFRDEDNQQYKYEMRTERKMLRINMINMQQLGELDTSISLSRVNFIYECKMRSRVKMGVLSKGYIDMYIVPRGEEIYSFKNKKLLFRKDIVNVFSQKLDKKKDYYVSLPKELIVHNFKFEGVWGFDKDEYDSFVKDKMRERRFQKSLKLTDEQAFFLVTKLEKWKNLKTFDLGNVGDKKLYNLGTKFFYKLKKYFDIHPEKFNAIRHHYK